MLLFVWERRASCWQRPRGALDLFCESVVVRRGVVKRGGGRRFGTYSKIPLKSIGGEVGDIGCSLRAADE